LSIVSIAMTGDPRTPVVGAIVSPHPDQRRGHDLDRDRDPRRQEVTSSTMPSRRHAVRAAGAVPIETLRNFARARHDRRGLERISRRAVRLQRRACRGAHDAEPLLALPGGSVLYADASPPGVLAQLKRTSSARRHRARARAHPDLITPFEFSPETIAVIDAVRAQARRS
jgi:hypothetical protein